MIRIGLADDHVLFRKGMIALLKQQEDFDVVTDNDNGKALLEAMETHPLDIVLMDLEMPEMDGKETTKVITERYPGTRVIMVSMHDDEQFIVHLMKMGACGYLLKNAEPNEITDAIRSVNETGYYFNNRVSRVMLGGLLTSEKLEPKFKDQDQLSEREVEVLRLICEEKTTAEIGEALFISPRTVEGHRNNILAKTGARNTAGMVVYAIRNGVVEV